MDQDGLDQGIFLRMPLAVFLWVSSESMATYYCIKIVTHACKALFSKIISSLYFSWHWSHNLASWIFSVKVREQNRRDSSLFSVFAKLLHSVGSSLSMIVIKLVSSASHFYSRLNLPPPRLTVDKCGSVVMSLCHTRYPRCSNCQNKHHRSYGLPRMIFATSSNGNWTEMQYQLITI